MNKDTKHSLARWLCLLWLVGSGTLTPLAQRSRAADAAALAEPRFYLLLLGFFAGVTLLLVSMGIYGVMAYLVSQRRHEIGIRIALGAQTRDVLRLVLGDGLWLTAIGIGAGALTALALGRWIRNLLYEQSATDPLTFALIALLLASVALVACYVPARRASKIDPLVALRHE